MVQRRGLMALTEMRGRAWPGYAAARTWLVIRGRLPWRLMGFLRDAHRFAPLASNFTSL